jgi:hypothetical protein
MPGKEALKLNLLENAYDYLIASLENVARARRDQSQVAWKFALLNLTFAIELLLKERLRRANPLLIYADIDKYKPITRETKTVSWTVLIERIKYILGKGFNDIDAGRLKLAQQLRNQMLHYDVELVFPAVYHDFANLLNFLTNFYNIEIRSTEKETLHDHVPAQLWGEQDDLSQAFFEDVDFYNEIFMAVERIADIKLEQSHPVLIIDGLQYPRIPYGLEHEDDQLFSNAAHLCHDCSVITGQFHLFGCDVERCPKCRQQLITCACVCLYPDDNPSSE